MPYFIRRRTLASVAVLAAILAGLIGASWEPGRARASTNEQAYGGDERRTPIAVEASLDVLPAIDKQATVTQAYREQSRSVISSIDPVKHSD